MGEWATGVGADQGTVCEESRESALSVEHDLDALVLDYARAASCSDDLPRTSNEMIRRFCECCGADCAYVFDYHSDRPGRVLEWHRGNAGFDSDVHWSIARLIVGRRVSHFEIGESMIVEDVALLKNHAPREHELLADRGIARFAIASLECKGEVIGFMGVDNLSPECMGNADMALKTLGYLYLLARRCYGAERELKSEGAQGGVRSAGACDGSGVGQALPLADGAMPVGAPGAADTTDATGAALPATGDIAGAEASSSGSSGKGMRNAVPRRNAFVDEVTGGSNRAYFEIEAMQKVLDAPPNAYALICADIQDFRAINDGFGIEEGDRVLGCAYRAFERDLEEGEYVARIAADNFNLLVKADERNALHARVVSILRDAIASVEESCAWVRSLSFSAGVYVIDDLDQTMTQMRECAIVARQKAERKRADESSGEGASLVCCFYDDEDRVQHIVEKEIMNRTRTALDAGEFVIHLQPKLDLHKNAVTGAEALVRWRDPRVGLKLPRAFIPLFERNGFAVDIDLFVFEQVCALLHAWSVAGVRPVPISVNLSHAHLFDPRFLRPFDAIRELYGVSSSLIEFELAEAFAVENPSVLTSVVDRIHRSGYACSVDNFGGGDSSMNVLKRLEVDALKLDSAFFGGPYVGPSRSTDAIVSVISLSQRLHMKTIAEGVETEEQQAFLADAGCDMVQGYLISSPVSVADFERLMYGREIATAQRAADLA